MGSAETAYRCLISKDAVTAQNLARELESVNQDRQLVQNQIWDQVREVAEAGLLEGKFPHAIVVASAEWHEGVVGIVASRVTEFFKKPAVIMAIREDGLTKGSARSYGGYSILDALHASASLLKTYGGHKYAAGVSLDHDQLEAFCKNFNDAIALQVPSKNKGKLNLEGSCDLAELTPKTLEELERLGPFGPGNPEPVFSVYAWVETQSVLKGRHLKLKLCEPPWVVEGIWFNAAERQEWMFAMEKSAQMKIRRGFAGIPELNRFRGRVTPSLRIKDLAPE
jgi:single-stranded-DNA-specific exonuclease